MPLARILCLHLLLLVSLPAFSCGTVDNWMDAYEGVESNNKWRDSMNQLESLVMLRGCGGPARLKKRQQERMLRILTDAVSRKYQLARLPYNNRDIRSQVKRYRGLLPFEGLLESIYRRYDCLQDVRSNVVLKVNGLKTIYEYFGEGICPEYR
ncbi:MAG: hypothetical protein KAQ67_04550 [Gammaproteobacteria bacterium]|nr:hypothetical protein [Gammaproteobacteria bacterium]